MRIIDKFIWKIIFVLMILAFVSGLIPTVIPVEVQFNLGEFTDPPLISMIAGADIIRETPNKSVDMR